MSSRSKRSGDSPYPDAAPPVVKRAKTTSGVRKGRAVRDGLNAVDPRVPSARVYGAYVNPDAADLLRQARTEGGYYVGLEYFWAQLFMQSRDYNPEELEDLFRQTIPPFAGDERSKMGCQLAERFEDVFNSYQAFFLERISAYSARWLQSESGKDWAEARALAL
jgi:hypothetical protein